MRTPEVSFYVLASESEAGRHLFVCKLAEKAYREQHRVYILTASDAQAQQLDDLLWTFRAGSFIPHKRYSGDTPAPDNPLLVGTLKAPEGWRQTLINLAQDIPESPGDYERIIEILDNSEACKQAGRQRYRQYQAAGFTINTHNMSG